MLRSIASSSRAAAAATAAAAGLATPSHAHLKAADETVTGEAKAGDKVRREKKEARAGGGRAGAGGRMRAHGPPNTSAHPGAPSRRRAM